MWISLTDFAALAEISYRRAAKIAEAARASSRTWRGARLEVKPVIGAGGSAGKQYQVRLSSLPVPLQIEWHRQQPQADLRELVAEHEALIEEERSLGVRKNRKRFNNKPWTDEERRIRHAAFTRLPTSMQAKAKRCFEIVLLFRSFGGSDVPLSQRYAIAAHKAGASVSAIRNWVGICKNLHQGDWLVALAPKHRGRLAAEPISPDAWEYIKAEYFKTARPDLKPIYRRAAKIAPEKGWTLPSYQTVKRLVKAEPHWFHVLMREGREAAMQLFPAQERDYSKLKLHELWCSDGHMADVFVRWEDGSVSRPIVVAWNDVRSRVCLGWAIGRTESADLIRLAFRSAAENSGALPEAALLDNGRAFASKLLTGGTPNRYRFSVREEEIPGILTLLGIEVTWALPYSGRSKPIESWWRTLAEMDKRFGAAYCGNRPEARPEDCDPNKAVPIAHYRAILKETIDAYHEQPHRGDAMDGRSPRESYADLLAQTPVRHPTPEQLRLCMLAAESIKLDSKDGSVRILGNRYWTEKLAALPREVAYVARFDPEDATQPVSIYRGEEFICTAPIVARTGFRDQQAAKDSVRANRRFLKGLEQQAGAIRDMKQAAAWLASHSGEGDADPIKAAAAEALLPAPKLVRPVRPEKDYRPAAAEKSSISKEEVMRFVTADFARRRKGG